jgi:L-alanine-DL-glutamate epimerase-like enolase superfamily enzyme
MRLPLGEVGQPWRDGFPSGVDAVLVEVETDQGLSGISIPHLDASVRAIPLLLEKYLRDILIGADPHRPPKLWQQMLTAQRAVDWRNMLLPAIAAVDIALWDLVGKAAGLPLFQLLGAYRGQVPVYASWGLGRTPTEELLDCYRQRITDQGFRAIKFAIGELPIAEDVQKLVEIREALGDDISIHIDAQARWHPRYAPDYAARLAPYHITWLEEPISPYDIEAQLHLADVLSVPMATGENQAAITEFRDLICSGDVAFIQPDPLRVGGITPCRTIMSLAEAWGIPFAPHCNIEVSMHLVAAAATGYVVEYLGLAEVVLNHVFVDFPVVVEGVLTLPQKPGLGLSLNWDNIATNAVDQIVIE